MSRSARLDLSSDHRRLVLDLLSANLPRRAKTWVFGSRATGRARRYSDLDLAIDAGRRLTLDEFGKLVEVFSGSDLPYRIDLVDWQAIDDRFRKVIAGERVLLAEDAPPGAATAADAGGSASRRRGPRHPSGTPALRNPFT